MGTRGLFGFFYKGRLYLVYNHYDSYPSGLGCNLVNEIILAMYKNELGKWKELLEKIKVISGCDETVKPTNQDIENLRHYTDLKVSGQSTNDWYCLTYRSQGSIERTLKSGYLLTYYPVDDHKYPELEDYEDFGYVLNFDDDTFDVYGTSETDGRLPKSYPLSNLPNFIE
jgi:hypothetical protein